MSKEIIPQNNNNEEVDLGQLFKLIGQGFNKLFKFIGSILNKLFLAFVWSAFFVKKHFLKLVISAVIGAVLGFVIEKTRAPVYESHVVVKQNYPKIGENLFNTLTYYNELVSQRDIETLANTLGVDTTKVDVSSILGFSMKSIITENQKILEYDKYLKELDSTLAKSIAYKDYLKNEKDYNNQMQQITIRANERSNLKMVYEKIIEGVKENEYFKREKAKDSIELKNEEFFLKEALRKSDTLQETYKNILKESVKANTEKGGQVNIDMAGDSSIDKTKEFDLFINDITLREKLKNNLREQEEKKHVIEVISSKQDRGSLDNSKELFGLNLGLKKYYAVLFLAFTFLLLIGIEFVKFLERFRDKIN